MQLHVRLRRWARFQEEAICRAERELELDTADQFCNYLADQIEQQYMTIPCDKEGKPWRIGEAALTDQNEYVVISGVASPCSLFVVMHTHEEREYQIFRADRLRHLPHDYNFLSSCVEEPTRAITDTAYNSYTCTQCGGILREIYFGQGIRIMPARIPRKGSSIKGLKACENCGLVYLKEI